jgi:hypothetical protein
MLSNTSSQSLCTDPTENTVFCHQEGLFINPLPTNRRPIVARVCLCGNVFTESLPSNGSVCHITSIIVHNSDPYVKIRYRHVFIKLYLGLIQEQDPPGWGFITGLVTRSYNKRHTQIPDKKISRIDNTLTTKIKKKDKMKAVCNGEN